MANSNNRCVISLSSATYAMSAERLLNGKGIAARVVKTDSSAHKKGCSNGIEVDCRRLPEARGILINNSIPISKVL